MMSLKRDHVDFYGNVRVIILLSRGPPDQLFGYTNFNLCIMMRDQSLKNILQSNPSKKLINHIIKNMTCLSTIDKNGKSLVDYLVTYTKDFKLVKKLVYKYQLDRYCNISVRTACKINSLKFIKKLVNEGYELESIDEKENKPIHIACKYGSIKIVKYLVANNVNLECENMNGKKAISYACYNGLLDIIIILVDNNISLECIDVHGWKPIHYICRYGNNDAIIYLLTQNIGLDTIVLNSGYDDNGIDYNDYSIKELILVNNKLTVREKTKILEIIIRKEIQLQST